MGANDNHVHALSADEGLHLLVDVSFENNRTNLDPVELARGHELVHMAIEITLCNFGRKLHGVRAGKRESQR